MSRACPDCGSVLSVKRSKASADTVSVEVDVCAQCDGLFLDAGEFDALVAPKLRGRPLEMVLSSLGEPPSLCRYCGEVQRGTLCALCGKALQRVCPHDGQGMLELSFDELLASRCAACSGLWLGGAARRAMTKAILRRSALSPALAAPSPPSAPQPQPSGVPAKRGGEPVERLVSISTAGIELDLPAPTTAVEALPSALVDCVACAGRVERAYTVRVAEVVYCEACVAEGRAPGVYSQPSISELRLRAAKAIMEARAPLERQRAEMADREGRTRRGIYGRSANPILFNTLSRLIRSLF